MSRIGKKPVMLPAEVTVKIHGRELNVTGPKGSLTWTHSPAACVAIDEAARRVTITRTNDTKVARASHGLTRALINNMVTGVVHGFEKRLLIYGTGYNCKLQGRTLHLNVGYSGRGHGRESQFQLPVPEGVEVVVERAAARGDTDPASVLIKGIDKQKVGQFAAEIRGLRTSEPYKGKGIRYDNEFVRRKQGKALTTGG